MGTTFKRLAIPVTASIGVHVAAAAVFLYTMPPTKPPKPFETIQVTLVNEDAMRKSVSEVFDSDVSTLEREQANSRIVDTERVTSEIPIEIKADSTVASTSFEITKTPKQHQISKTISPATDYAHGNESVGSSLHDLDLLEQLPIITGFQSQEIPELRSNQPEQSAAADSTIAQPTNQSIESSLADEPTVALDVAETTASTKSVSDNRNSSETAVKPISKPPEDIELTEEYLNDENEIRLALFELADAAVAKIPTTQNGRNILDSARNTTEHTPPTIEDRSSTASVEKTEVTTEHPDNVLSAPVELPIEDSFIPEIESRVTVQMAQSQLEQPNFDTVDETVARQESVQTPIEQATNKYQLNTSTTTTLAALQRSKIDSGSEYLEPAFGLKGLHNPAPRYPYLSRVNNEEGRVTLLVHVDREGAVTKIDTYESSGFRRLDRAALKTIKKWTFKPANVAGVPVAGAVHVPVKFVLND